MALKIIEKSYIKRLKKINIEVSNLCSEKISINDRNIRLKNIESEKHEIAEKYGFSICYHCGIIKPVVEMYGKHKTSAFSKCSSFCDFPDINTGSKIY